MLPAKTDYDIFLSDFQIDPRFLEESFDSMASVSDVTLPDDRALLALMANGTSFSHLLQSPESHTEPDDFAASVARLHDYLLDNSLSGSDVFADQALARSGSLALLQYPGCPNSEDHQHGASSTQLASSLSSFQTPGSETGDTNRGSGSVQDAASFYDVDGSSSFRQGQFSAYDLPVPRYAMIPHGLVGSPSLSMESDHALSACVSHESTPLLCLPSAISSKSEDSPTLPPWDVCTPEQDCEYDERGDEKAFICKEEHDDGSRGEPIVLSSPASMSPEVEVASSRSRNHRATYSLTRSGKMSGGAPKDKRIRSGSYRSPKRKFTGAPVQCTVIFCYYERPSDGMRCQCHFVRMNDLQRHWMTVHLGHEDKCFKEHTPIDELPMHRKGFRRTSHVCSCGIDCGRPDTLQSHQRGKKCKKEPYRPIKRDVCKWEMVQDAALRRRAVVRKPTMQSREILSIKQTIDFWEGTFEPRQEEDGKPGIVLK